MNGRDDPELCEPDPDMAYEAYLEQEAEELVHCQQCEKGECKSCLLAVECIYCEGKVGIGKAVKMDGEYYCLECHKQMVQEACYFCQSWEETGDCAEDCTLIPYAAKYFEEEK